MHIGYETLTHVVVWLKYRNQPKTKRLFHLPENEVAEDIRQEKEENGELQHLFRAKENGTCLGLGVIVDGSGEQWNQTLMVVAYLMKPQET